MWTAILGQDEVLEADHQVNASGEIVYKLGGQAEEFIPEQRVVGSKVFLGVNDQISVAGYYDLFLTPEEVLAQYAFNFDRKESALSYFSEADLTKMTEKNPNVKVIAQTANADFGVTISERSRGIVLWRWCIILALVFLGIETLLLRFWQV